MLRRFLKLMKTGKSAGKLEGPKEPEALQQVRQELKRLQRENEQAHRESTMFLPYRVGEQARLSHGDKALLAIVALLGIMLLLLLPGR